MYNKKENNQPTIKSPQFKHNRLWLALFGLVSGAVTANDVSSISKELASTAVERKYKPAVELALKVGNQRHISRLGTVVPVLQNDHSLLHVTLIGMLDSKSAKEGNFGLGYRYRGEQGIYGVYGFYDLRRTARHNLLKQITLGSEFLGDHLELRGNIYLPFKKQYEVSNIKKLNAKFDGHRTYYFNEVHSSYEKGLRGFDIEIGGNIPHYEKIQAHLAYYYFGLGSSGTKSVKGFRGRAAYQLNDYLALEGEVSHDKVRHTNYFAGARFNWSFGGQSSKNRLDALDKKMTSLPVRDIDIVAGDSSESMEEALGNVVGRIPLYVPNVGGRGGKLLIPHSAGAEEHDVNDPARVWAAMPQCDGLAVSQSGGHIVSATREQLGHSDLSSQARGELLYWLEQVGISPQELLANLFPELELSQESSLGGLPSDATANLGGREMTFAQVLSALGFANEKAFIQSQKSDGGLIKLYKKRQDAFRSASQAVTEHRTRLKAEEEVFDKLKKLKEMKSRKKGHNVSLKRRNQNAHKKMQELAKNCQATNPTLAKNLRELSATIDLGQGGARYTTVLSEPSLVKLSGLRMESRELSLLKQRDAAKERLDKTPTLLSVFVESAVKRQITELGLEQGAFSSELSSLKARASEEKFS